ncbi:unnamed protein product, partial [Urochloa humidicola]
ARCAPPPLPQFPLPKPNHARRLVPCLHGRTSLLLLEWSMPSAGVAPFPCGCGRDGGSNGAAAVGYVYYIKVFLPIPSWLGLTMATGLANAAAAFTTYAVAVPTRPAPANLAGTAASSPDSLSFPPH